MQSNAETLLAPEANDTPFFRRAHAFLGAAGLSCALLLSPEAAHADEGIPVSYAKSSLSPREAMETCQDSIRVVAHESSAPNRRAKYAVNTREWMQHEVRQGHNIIEVDAQVSSDDTFFGFHDRLLNANTRNGSGVAHHKRSNYIQKLRTLTGDRLSDTDDLLHVLRRNPDVQLQHEFKDYDQQWTKNRLEKWYQTFSKSGVLTQINVSSASPRIIKWFGAKHPDVSDRQLIGFGNRLPSLPLARKIGATQVNVTSDAGLRNGAAYLKRAHKMGLRTSVRSNPNGRGDDGYTWLRAIENNVDQIVTQGPTKYFVCRAVQKAARR
jgi:glycerophosphoryl diester phosphodiesterase